VKAIWLRRILDAQRSDGGWDGLDIIAHVPGNRVICWTASKYPHLLASPPTEFHSTAQGLYLMALLMSS
jgi:hypothetical protein